MFSLADCRAIRGLHMKGWEFNPRTNAVRLIRLSVILRLGVSEIASIGKPFVEKQQSNVSLRKLKSLNVVKLGFVLTKEVQASFLLITYLLLNCVLY